jgi:hypothetical protein
MEPSLRAAFATRPLPRSVLPAAAALALAACSPASAPGDAASSDTAPLDAAVDAPPVITTVPLFDHTQVSFTGTENHRTVDAPATFPAGPFRRVTLHLALDCPSNRCDPWDRLASLSLLDPTMPVGDAGAPTELEFARFVTTFGVAGTWDLDVTDLQPLFVGTRTARGFIDTWVGPGSQYGNGWLLTASLDFESGRPDRTPVQVIPLGWSQAVAGDPARSIPSQLGPRAVTLPASGFGAAAAYVITTGHGQGNRDNCAEFCSRTHSLLLDGAAHPRVVWRDDCADNPINNQRGSWQYARAGWCPGDVVRPWIEDLGAALAPGSTHTLGYDVEAYVNTCRPDAMPCASCTLGATCAYDGGNHTEPFYRVTGYLVLYAP